jgi:hypothetical protein
MLMLLRKPIMITLRISTEVKADRQVVLTLPPEVPTGMAELVVTVSSPNIPEKKQPRTSLADWAEANAEDWGNQLNSEDVEGFTGRRF